MALIGTATDTGSVQQVQSVTISYGLTGAVSCTTTGWAAPTPCQNVSGHTTGNVRTLEGVIDPSLEVLAAGGLVSTALAGLGALGRTFGRSQLTLTLTLAIAITAAGLALPIASVVVGPGSQAATYCGELSGNQTYCPSYWGGATTGSIPGDCSPCGESLHWGAGTAWYETIAASGLFVLAWYLLWVDRDRPFTKEERDAWEASLVTSLLSPKPAATPSTRVASLTPPPPSNAPPVRMRNALPPPTEPRGPWSCPECRTTNSPWAMHCGQCHAPRPGS